MKLRTGPDVPVRDRLEAVGGGEHDAQAHPFQRGRNGVRVDGMIEQNTRLLLGKEALELAVIGLALRPIRLASSVFEELIGNAIGPAGDVETTFDLRAVP